MNTQEYLDRINLVIERGEGTEHLPATAPVIAMFAVNYRPLVPADESGDNMTSAEIADLLEDTCSLSLTDVAVVMAHLGYRLHVNAYRGHEWSMAAVSEEK